MKHILITFFLIHFLLIATAQTDTVNVHTDVSTHFICSEPIVYVDISTDEVEGDLPVSNILRIKPRFEQVAGYITIVTATYMAQFALQSRDQADTRIMVNGENAAGLIIPENTLSVAEMKTYCSQALEQSDRRPIQQMKKRGISMALNHIYTIGDYFLIDLTFTNEANIRYDIDKVRFSICDEKVTKATNIQSREIAPEYQYYHTERFNKRYRNIFVFKKFTFPDRKVFEIELTEKQISGRNITLRIPYRDILQTDIL